MNKLLTVEQLKAMQPNEIFATGETTIIHPWFNDAVHTLEEDGRSTKVRWVAIRGGIHDWAIYHSLDANLEPARYLDGTTHLSCSVSQIARGGAKMYREEEIRKCVPCTDDAFKLYRL